MEPKTSITKIQLGACCHARSVASNSLNSCMCGFQLHENIKIPVSYIKLTKCFALFYFIVMPTPPPPPNYYYINSGNNQLCLSILHQMASVLEEYLNEHSENAVIKISSTFETFDCAPVCTLNIPNTLLCL